MSKNRHCLTSQSYIHHRAQPCRYIWRTLMVALLVSGGIVTPGAIAQVTSAPPGTISNQATGSFVDPADNSTTTLESNIVTVSVSEVAGITVTSSGYTEPTDGVVSNDDTVFFGFVVKNVGNDPTQFFIPGSPASLGGGTAGPIEIIAYDPDGTGAAAEENLSGNNITVPASGERTGNLLSPVAATTNNGSIPAGGTLTIRVPVTVTGANGTNLSITLGNTPATPNNQNQSYTLPVTDSENLYTVDNTAADNGDTDGAPINGEREASDSVTVAITAPPEYIISGQVRDDLDNDGDLTDADSGIGSVSVTLFDDGDGDGDPTGSSELETVTTNSSGNYSFTPRIAGDYVVVETDLSGYTSTNDSDGFNNNRIAVALSGADSTDNDFLDSNTPLPAPDPQSCNTTFDFTWGSGGAVWNVNDTNNTYTNVDASGIDVALAQLDPFNQNIDSNNTFPGRDPFFTTTNGAYGPTYLTWAMTAENSNQVVSFVFDFSQPLLIDDLQVIDLDGTNLGSAASSFQDEIAVTGLLDGIDVPLTLSPEAAGTMTITGQSATGSYTGGNLSHLDSRGHLVIRSSAPISRLRLDYSNGPADASDGSGGRSNGHAIAIDQVFRFCEAPPRNISGYVRDDVDGDGDLNDADNGIDSVTVDLFSDPNGDGDPVDGSLVLSRTTSSDGSFSFNNVNPGRYVIIERNPVDFNSSADSSGDNDDQIPVAVSTADSTNNIFLDTLLPTVLNPNIRLTKRIVAINRGRADERLFEATYVDVGAPDDNDNIVNWPGIAVPAEGGGSVESYIVGATGIDEITATTNTTVRPGDEIEYAISFLSDGDAAATDMLLCDRIPANTTFVPDAFNALNPTSGGARGILLNFNNETLALTNANDGDESIGTIANDGFGGYYFLPGEDPSLTFPGLSCASPNNTGAIVVDLSSVPNATGEGTPDNSYGFIRFRVVVD